TLTEEERLQEEAMQEQLENGDVVILDENGNPVANPSGENQGDLDGEAVQNPSGTGNASGENYPAEQPGGIPGEVLQGQEPVTSPDTGQTNTEQAPPADSGNTVQPGGIPGEVLKQDAV
ncbi:MAG: hypothetical protein II242_02425, partial [Peptococcaceae bacterium]|nr:hypothetical protein [Peptococcaceae bacterium]